MRLIEGLLGEWHSLRSENANLALPLVECVQDSGIRLHAEPSGQQDGTFLSLKASGYAKDLAKMKVLQKLYQEHFHQFSHNIARMKLLKAQLRNLHASHADKMVKLQAALALKEIEKKQHAHSHQVFSELQRFAKKETG